MGLTTEGEIVLLPARHRILESLNYSSGMHRWSEMIEQFDYFALHIPMSRVFRTSLGSTETYSGFLVRLKTDDGREGWGEAVPARRITGETEESIRGALETMKGIVLGREETSAELIWKAMEESAIGSYSAKCAIDVALWDLTGKKAGMPLCRLLGGFRDRMETSFTVDLGSMEEAEEQIEEFTSMGVCALKVKLGKGMREDYERVKKARQRGGDGIKVYVDFNQSYTPKKALDLAHTIQKFEVEFLEQPVRANDLEGLKFVRDRSPIPVMADESVHSPADAIKIVRLEAADMLNMKLVKAGGITQGKRIIEIAEAAGMPVMIGCTVETKVGITAATHLALALRNVAYTDLDGYYSLSRDVTSDGVRLVEGKHMVGAGPGLGIGVKIE